MPNAIRILDRVQDMTDVPAPTVLNHGDALVWDNGLGHYVYNDFVGYFVKVDGSTPLINPWDIGSGMYLIADKIRARGGGGELLLANSSSYGILIKSDGKVGIGITSPNQELSVSGDIEATNSLISPVLMPPTTGGLTIQDSTATMQITVKDFGVGIETVNPMALLHVGPGSVTPSTTTPTLLAYHTIDTSLVIKKQSGVEAAITATSTVLNIDATGSIVVKNSGVTVLTVNSGNVILASTVWLGIGTTPAYQLDLRGSGAASQLHFSSGSLDSGGYATSAGVDNFLFHGGVLWDGTQWVAKATNAGIIGTTAGRLSFFADAGLTAGVAYTPTERIRILNDGKVGINNTAPSTWLHVTAAAVASAQEEVVRFTVSDDAGSYFRVLNATTADSTFIPSVETLQGAALLGRFDIVRVTTDTGTNPGYAIDVRTAAATAVTVRPLYDVRTQGSTKFMVHGNGSIGIGVTPSILVGIGIDVNGTTIRLRTTRTPATAAASGAAGEICWDAGFIYVCTAANTWKRVAIATW